MMPNRVKYAFDGKNPEAQALADAIERNYVWRIAKGQRDDIEKLVRAAIANGYPPRDLARQVQQVVGLDGRRMGALVKYREFLSNTGLKPSRQDRLVDRYARKLLRDRAQTIARTETMGALNAGQHAMLKQIGDRPKEWITTPDDRLCPVCEPVDGETVGIDEAFSPGVLYPPAHPKCRCTIAPGDPAKRGRNPKPIPSTTN